MIMYSTDEPKVAANDSRAVFEPRGPARSLRRLLERISHFVVLSQPHLFLFLCGGMLDPDLLGVRLHEFTYKSGIPQFGGDAQIFAAAHKGVGFATLSCR